MKELQVVSAVIKNSEGQILCMQRGDGKNLETAFKWEFPGGKVDDGETPEEAILREIKEELNIDIEILGNLGKFVHSYSDFVLNMTCFNCSTKNTEFELIVHNDFKWLYPNELMSLDWSPGDIPVAKKLLSDLE